MSNIRNFQWKNPTHLIVKENASPEIATYIARDGFKKILLVMGQGSVKKIGLYDQVVKALKEQKIQIVELEGIRPNPEVSSVVKGIDLCRQHYIDAILPLGGGSVFDSAKGIAVGATFAKDVPSSSIWEVYEGTRKVEKALPIYGVLTMSASGSECNAGSVVQADNQNKKWFFNHPSIFPKVSIIDPVVQSHLPWYQTANGLIDAVMHVFESCSSIRNLEDQFLTFAIDVQLIKSMIRAGNQLQSNEKDYPARANFIWAAAAALNGFASLTLMGPDTGVHSFEHAMGAINPKISHGAGLAVAFPAFIRANAACGLRLEIYDALAKQVYGKSGWQGLIEGWVEMVKRWGHPTTLAELYGREITQQDRDDILRVFLLKPFCLYYEDRRCPEDLAKATIGFM